MKDVDPQLAKDQIQSIDENLSTKEDINKYMAKLMAIDLDRSKPLWQIHIKEDYGKDTSVIFF